MKSFAQGLSLAALAIAAAMPVRAASAEAGTAPAASQEPFSHLAFEGGIGLNGVNMQAATNVNRHFNIRATGNYFSYTLSNVKVSGNNGSNGINVNGKLNFATTGVSLDYYPFPSHGFRISPGFVVLNQNAISASGVASTGTSLTLGSQKYYSDAVNPLSLNASLGLNAHPQTFSLTTGWGNMISRKGGHWAFPVEIGAIFSGAPTVGFKLTGNACTVQSDAAINGASCVNMATNSTAQANIAAQVAKYQNDVNPLKVYPILTFGVSYNFRIR